MTVSSAVWKICNCTRTLLNRDEGIRQRKTAASELAQLLKDEKAVELAERLLIAEHLPADVDLVSSGSYDVHVFVQRLAGLEDYVNQTHQAYLEIPEKYFEIRESNCRDSFLQVAIDEGIFHLIVKCATGNGKVAAVHFSAAANKKITAFPAHRTIVSKWITSLICSDPKSQRARAKSNIQESDAKFVERIQKKRKRFSPVAERERVKNAERTIESYLQNGDVDAARQAAKKLIHSQIEKTLYIGFPCQTLCALSKRAKSRKYFKLQLEWAAWAIELMPTHPFAATQYGLALISNRMFDEALKHFEKCVLEHPDNALAKNSLAEMLERKGRYKEALLYYEFVIEHHHDNRKARFGRADVLKALKRYKEALQAYDIAIAFDPKDAIPQCSRAGVLMLMGRFDESLEAYEKIIQARPNFGSAIEGRIKALDAVGRMDDAFLDSSMEMYGHVCPECQAIAFRCGCGNGPS